MLDGIHNFIFNSFPNIAINVYNINSITHVNFLVMGRRKLCKLLLCWSSCIFTVNTLQNVRACLESLQKRKKGVK